MYANQARYVCSHFELSVDCHPGAPLERYVCARGWQGGGLFTKGTATLTNNNVYDNQAIWVCSSFEHFLNFHQSPRWNVTCAHGWQEFDGGGLYISGTATLTNTNVFENQAGDVCSPFELFVRTFLLVPCWNVACAHGWQDGGGLYISGTATLTNTNVHANRAAYVCLLFEYVRTFPPAELT